MKKVILLFCISLLFTTSVYADEVKEKTTEELIAEYMKMDERQKELRRQETQARAELEAEKRKTQAMKKETESARQVGRKLDELLGILSKDK